MAKQLDQPEEIDGCPPDPTLIGDLAWHRPEFVEGLIHSWINWLGQQDDPEAATTRLMASFHYFVVPEQTKSDNPRLLDLLRMKDSEEGERIFGLNQQNEDKGDVASAYGGVSSLLKLFLGANPLAQGQGVQNRAWRLVGSVPRVRQMCATFASGASGFDEIILRVGAGFCQSDLGSLTDGEMSRCSTFINLYMKFMKGYYLVVRCWLHLSRTVLRDRQNRLLFLIGYGESPRDSDYRSLREAMERGVRKPNTESISDAAQTDDLLGDFIMKAMVDIRRLPEAEVVEKAMRGAYSSLGLFGKHNDRLKSRATKGRKKTVEQGSEEGSRIALEIVTAVSEYSLSVADADPWDWAAESLYEQESLSDEVRERLVSRFGPTAPRIVEVILYSPEDILKKNRESIHQGLVAKLVGCSENTVSRFMVKLTEDVTSSGQDERQYLFDLVGLDRQ
jgi:hypothetical protein